MSARKKISLYAVLGAILLFLGCNSLIAPLVYFAKPFGGRVIDAESLQPIEGAVVVAEWRPYYLLFVDRSTPMKVVETVTDAQGNYSFPGWGPRLRLWTERLDVCDPELAVFKMGYKARLEVNERSRNTYVRASDWDGVELELEPFRGTPAERLHEFEYILSETAWDLQMPTRLGREMLKESPLAVSAAKPFFDGVDRLTRKGP